MGDYWPGYPHVLDTRQFSSLDVLSLIFRLADEMKSSVKSGERLPDAAGKKLLTLFFEPSTRTRLSFESAVLNLGGSTLSAEHAGIFSSFAKGESIEDAARVLSSYCDAIVIRHPENGAAERLARYSRVPVINAGDGGNQHPTQALPDLYTIREELGRLSGLRIGFVGDLKKGRTVKSLAYLLAKVQRSAAIN